MFQKIVAVEPVNLLPAAKERLHEFAKEVVLYDSLPADDEEIIRRVGDADAALISYTTRMGRKAVTGCPNLRYIGMCCSLYEEKSANVDIAAAREKGIVVTGVKDYGDEGVVEYVISELVRYLHGFGPKQWRADPGCSTSARTCATSAARESPPSRRRTATAGWSFRSSSRTATRFSPA